MSRDRKRIDGARRVPGRRAGGRHARCWRDGAAVAEAVPANFWGVVPQATPTAEQFQRLKRGGVDSVRIPIVWGAVQPAKGGAARLVRRRSARRRTRRRPASKCCPSSPAPRLGGAGGAGSGRYGQGAEEPAGQDRRRQQSAWATFLKLAVARYGPNGTFWADNPTRAEAPDPHLADLERGELQVLRRPVRTRPNTASW